jgi:CRISPR-associated protein Csb2
LDSRGLQIGSAEHDLRRLLGNQSELLKSATPLSHNLIGTVEWRRFKTYRKTGFGNRGGCPPTGFILEFGEPVPGPFALGYASHFGLGLFVPHPNVQP